MKTVLISGDENSVPAQYLQQIRDAGIELECKKCIGESEVEEFSKGAELIWMFGPNRGLTGDVLKRLPECKGIFRSGILSDVFRNGDGGAGCAHRTEAWSFGTCARTCALRGILR